MRKIIFVLIAFVMFSINIDNVNAAYDKNKELLKEYVELAEKVEVKYILDEEYVDENGNPKNGMFKIEISGLSEELKIRLLDKEEWYYLRDAVDDVITINGVESGGKKIGVYYREYVTLLRTIRVNIPVYNYYSERVECQGISEDDLDVCDPWYKYELNESTFLSKVNKYKNEQEKILSEENKNGNRVVSFFNKVIDFLMDYFVYIIIGIIMIVSLVIFIVIKKKQYSLE